MLRPQKDNVCPFLGRVQGEKVCFKTQNFNVISFSPGAVLFEIIKSLIVFRYKTSNKRWQEGFFILTRTNASQGMVDSMRVQPITLRP